MRFVTIQQQNCDKPSICTFPPDFPQTHEIADSTRHTLKSNWTDISAPTKSGPVPDIHESKNLISSTGHATHAKVNASATLPNWSPLFPPSQSGSRHSGLTAAQKKSQPTGLFEPRPTDFTMHYIGTSSPSWIKTRYQQSQGSRKPSNSGLMTGLLPPRGAEYVVDKTGLPSHQSNLNPTRRSFTLTLGISPLVDAATSSHRTHAQKHTTTHTSATPPDPLSHTCHGPPGISHFGTDPTKLVDDADSGETDSSSYSETPVTCSSCSSRIGSQTVWRSSSESTAPDPSKESQPRVHPPEDPISPEREIPPLNRGSLHNIAGIRQPPPRAVGALELCESAIPNSGSRLRAPPTGSLDSRRSLDLLDSSKVTDRPPSVHLRSASYNLEEAVSGAMTVSGAMGATVVVTPNGQEGGARNSAAMDQEFGGGKADNPKITVPSNSTQHRRDPAGQPPRLPLKGAISPARVSPLTCYDPSVPNCQTSSPNQASMATNRPFPFKRIAKDPGAVVGCLVSSPSKTYRVERQLQTAIYGGVYLVSDVTASRDDGNLMEHFGGRPKLALKVMLKHIEEKNRGTLQEDITAEKRFQKLMTSHPNLLSFLEQWEELDCIFLVMAYAEFEDLFEVLKKRKAPFSEKEARWLFAQILEGTAHLHRHRVAFRDHSLENVLLFRDPADSKTILPRITDPGQAVVFDTDDRDNPKPIVADKLFGKSFRPPEVHSKKPYNPITIDTFCLGWMLFFSVTKHQPFDRTSDNDQYWNLVKRGRFSDLLRARGGSRLSGPLCELLCSMLHPDFRRRPTIVSCLQHKWFRCGTKTPITVETIYGSFATYQGTKPVRRPMDCNSASSLTGTRQKKPVPPGSGSLFWNKQNTADRTALNSHSNHHKVLSQSNSYSPVPVIRLSSLKNQKSNTLTQQYVRDRLPRGFATNRPLARHLPDGINAAGCLDTKRSLHKSQTERRARDSLPTPPIQLFSVSTSPLSGLTQSLGPLSETDHDAEKSTDLLVSPTTPKSSDDVNKSLDANFLRQPHIHLLRKTLKQSASHPWTARRSAVTPSPAVLPTERSKLAPPCLLGSARAPQFSVTREWQPIGPCISSKTDDGVEARPSIAWRRSVEFPVSDSLRRSQLSHGLDVGSGSRIPSAARPSPMLLMPVGRNMATQGEDMSAAISNSKFKPSNPPNELIDSITLKNESDVKDPLPVNPILNSRHLKPEIPRAPGGSEALRRAFAVAGQAQTSAGGNPVGNHKHRFAPSTSSGELDSRRGLKTSRVYSSSTKAIPPRVDRSSISGGVSVSAHRGTGISLCNLHERGDLSVGSDPPISARTPQPSPSRGMITTDKNKQELVRRVKESEGEGQAIEAIVKHTGKTLPEWAPPVKIADSQRPSQSGGFRMYRTQRNIVATTPNAPPPSGTLKAGRLNVKGERNFSSSVGGAQGQVSSATRTRRPKSSVAYLNHGWTVSGSVGTNKNPEVSSSTGETPGPQSSWQKVLNHPDHINLIYHALNDDSNTYPLTDRRRDVMTDSPTITTTSAEESAEAQGQSLTDPDTDYLGQGSTSRSVSPDTGSALAVADYSAERNTDHRPPTTTVQTPPHGLVKNGSQQQSRPPHHQHSWNRSLNGAKEKFGPISLTRPTSDNENRNFVPLRSHTNSVESQTNLHLSRRINSKTSTSTGSVVQTTTTPDPSMEKMLVKFFHITSAGAGP